MPAPLSMADLKNRDRAREALNRMVAAARTITDVSDTMADEEIAVMEAVRETLVGANAERVKAALGLVQQLAEFRPGGVDQEDDSDTINSLIARAREIMKMRAP